MPNKTLSVQKEDLPLWEAGEQKARTERRSMSGYVLSLIDRDNPRDDKREVIIDKTDLIVVRMHAPGRGEWRESFTGKWVTSGLNTIDNTHSETGLCWRPGITATGRPVAYRSVTEDADARQKNGWSTEKTESLLLIFDTVEEFAEGVIKAGYAESHVKYAVASLEFAIIHHHASW